MGWHFADGDNFHPPANIQKISHGIPLDDSDRLPWLAALRLAILQWNTKKKDVVLACSALKRKYRQELLAPGVHFVYLEGTPELIAHRLQDRHGHFATQAILKSQFEDLEKPSNAITVQIDKTPEAIANEIVAKLQTMKVEYPDAAPNCS